MQTLLSNMRYLCDESRMLTGITAIYGTRDASESLSYGRAQEVQLQDGAWIPCLRAIDEKSIYDLASLTKLFTCVAALMLFEQGALDLDECVGEIDPRFENLKSVTVRDVLCYRACLQTDGRIDAADSREEGLRRLFSVKPAPLPAVRIYSDINAMVIKYVIEARSGMAFYDALRHFILIPCGMTRTYAAVPESEKKHCLCYNYEHRIVRSTYTMRTDTPCGAVHDPKALLLSGGGADLCGHAGLFSAAEDMIRFAQALLSGRLLSQKTLLSIGRNRTGQWNADGSYRQPMGLMCFTKHPYQRLSEVPAYTSANAFALSGFTGNHIVIDPVLGVFEVFLGNRCHNRISHITPPEGTALSEYGLDERGAAQIRWTDGRVLPTSARYVYLKDECLHEPIVRRMQALGWVNTL